MSFLDATRSFIFENFGNKKKTQSGGKVSCLLAGLVEKLHLLHLTDNVAPRHSVNISTNTVSESSRGGKLASFVFAPSLPRFRKAVRREPKEKKASP